ncbi:small ribosomal subunit protein mS29 isoform X2 [Parasteatoda tepidariorum]
MDIQMQTFRECAIMVREPAVEIISILSKIDFSNPAVRFVLHGANGTGKSSTLIHVLHYLYDSKFLLVHLPWASRWTKHVKEVVDSQYKERRIDLPVDSALWLQHFKSQNSSLLEELDLRVSKSYTWSKREVTEAGAPLTDVIEHGIERVRHASDCVAVLLKEIKLLSQSGRFKTAVVVDGVNAFFSKTNKFQFKKADKSVALADDITIVRAMKKLLNNDWNNAVVITSADMIPHDRYAKLYVQCTPHYLLGKEGFELLDPFIPINTSIFTDKELMSTIDYYCDRLWIQSEHARSDEGRQQLKFLSGNNPMMLKKLCDPL